MNPAEYPRRGGTQCCCHFVVTSIHLDEIALNIIERDGQKSRHIHQDESTERSGHQQANIGFERFQNYRREAAIK